MLSWVDSCRLMLERKNRLAVWVFLSWLPLTIGLSAAQTKMVLPVLMYAEHVESIEHLSTDLCLDIHHYPSGNQVLIEWLLLCQALALGGIDAEFELIPIPSQARAKLLLNQGQGAMAGFTFWRSQYESEFHYLSPQTIGKGEFVKALYTHPDHAAAFQQLTTDKLRRLSVVVNTEWKVDVTALSCFPRRYLTGISYPNMLKMVEDKKVDAILHNLAHRNDLKLESMGTALVPIPGVLVNLPDSLHFLVSKSYPGTERVSFAMQKGLTQLIRTKRVFEAYRAVAFFNPIVKDWRVIQCNP